jgi:hypothetical protein
MPSQVFEDSLDLYIDLLEVQATDPISGAFPNVKPTGQSESRRFRTIILENDYLRATIVPALGGRLLSLFDKRFQSECLKDIRHLRSTPYNESSIVEAGIVLGNEFGYRPNSLGPCDTKLIHTESKEDAAEVIVSEIHSGSSLTHLIRYQMGEQAVLRVEVTIQNRSLEYVECQQNELKIFSQGSEEVRSETFAQYGRIGILADPGTVEYTGHKSLRRGISVLAPRQVDSFAFQLIGIPSGIQVTHIDEQTCCQLGKTLQIAAHEPKLNHRLLVQNTAGETFEMPVTLHPEKLFGADLTSVPGSVLVAQLKDESNHIISTISNHVPNPVQVQTFTAPKIPIPKSAKRPQLLSQLSNPHLRLTSLIELAALATESGDHQAADRCYEQALLFNGDDPLLWWAKSANKRLGGLDADAPEKLELLNAHFLSPLEPCLRAEAFLSMPQTHGKEKSPVLEPLSEVPEVFIDVACRLIEARMYVDAGRFIDESLRHHSFAMLHYLAAALYVDKSSMKIEAADQLRLGNHAPFPPFPYRLQEKWALKVLLKAFPTDRTLKERVEHFA